MAIGRTREKILDISLELFAQRGYSAVSIRDICGRVPIKESTLYYYFQNKREIFLVLQQRFEEKAAALMRRMEEEIAAPLQGGAGFGGGVTQAFFEEYLMDPFCNAFLRLLRMEQGGDETLRETYDQWMFERPLTFQKKVFLALMEQGILQQADDDVLAVEYYAPIFMGFERYLSSGELTEEKKERFRREAGRQIAWFFQERGLI